MVNLEKQSNDLHIFMTVAYFFFFLLYVELNHTCSGSGVTHAISLQHRGPTPRVQVPQPCHGQYSDRRIEQECHYLGVDYFW